MHPAKALLDCLRGVGRPDPSAPPPATTWRCVGDGCTTTVPRRGAYCEPCAARGAERLRRQALTMAYASLPEWPWCRFGTPEFAAATAEIQEAVRTVRRWRRAVRNAGDVTGNLVLLGGTGKGKTACAVALAHWILDAARDGRAKDDGLAFAAGLRFVPAIDLATARREYKLGDGDPPIIRAAMSASFLILDEMGFLDARHDVTAIQEVLESRYRRSALFTVITSGGTKEQLDKVYGAATMRRVRALGQVIEVEGKAA